MARPSQLQQGLLAGVSGLFGGLQRRSEADAAERMKQAYLDAQMNKQQAADAERLKRELLQEEAKSKLYSMAPGEANEFLTNYGFKDPVFSGPERPNQALLGQMVQGKTREKVAAMPARVGKPSAYDAAKGRREAREQAVLAAKMAGAEDDDPKHWDAAQAAAGNQAWKNFLEMDLGAYNQRIKAEGYPELKLPTAVGDLITVTPGEEGTGIPGLRNLSDVFGTPPAPETRTVPPNLFGIPGAGAPQGNTITTKSGRTVKRVP